MTTSDHKVSRFPVPDLADMPEDIRERILAVQEKSGFIPNVFLTLAHRPDEFRAFFAYHDALMEKESGLTKAEREMIVVATSNLNQCQYCVGRPWRHPAHSGEKSADRRSGGGQLPKGGYHRPPKGHARFRSESLTIRLCSG